MMRFPPNSLEARLPVLRNEIQKVFLCVQQNNRAHTEKKSLLDVISMNFVHFIDQIVWHCICRNSFAEDENFEKPQVPFDATEHKKGKRIVLLNSI